VPQIAWISVAATGSRCFVRVAEIAPESLIVGAIAPAIARPRLTGPAAVIAPVLLTAPRAVAIGPREAAIAPREAVIAQRLPTVVALVQAIALLRPIAVAEAIEAAP
jgi:hypothetical protein